MRTRKEYEEAKLAVWLMGTDDILEDDKSFEEYLLDSGYLDYKKSMMMSGDIGKALSQIGDAEKENIKLHRLVKSLFNLAQSATLIPSVIYEDYKALEE